ncbi:hypothetical protein V5F38_02720 [Xanthobacter sp. V0B-10]|uniref:hypothetical protein n=1 Tax=Xanthobacter albus TaxID=3119929 RepID=UPI0037276DA1
MALLFGVLALAGCQTTEEANNAARETWIGMPADRFFMRNGPPASQYRADGGETVYIWTSGMETEVYQTTRTVNTRLPNGQNITSTVPGPDQVIPVECQFKIVAAANGRITDISIFKDMPGTWELSHCSKFLKEG